MRTVLAIATLGLALAACKPTAEGPNNAPEANAAAVPLKIGELSLNGPIRALGNEPFWHVDIDQTSITFARMDGTPVSGAGATPKVTGNLAVWETTLPDQKPLVVTLTGTDCSDGMSDRIYPLAAMVKVGDETLQGCAATVEALERASESGRVE
ncbi:hypothetical protein OB03_00245 [Brevundimonas sp. GN22]|uniref:COG3650 family protein n=1 Tax=Brevundimonas pishanensis TaxID=2896315 RepID=UPI001FA6B3ED|nr:hypothetical protein [Brevundimonas pishanensis]